MEIVVPTDFDRVFTGPMKNGVRYTDLRASCNSSCQSAIPGPVKPGFRLVRVVSFRVNHHRAAVSQSHVSRVTITVTNNLVVVAAGAQNSALWSMKRVVRILPDSKS